jgi:hypothetical protein
MARAARPPAPVPIVQLHMELEWVSPIIWREVQVPAKIFLENHVCTKHVQLIYLFLTMYI